MRWEMLPSQSFPSWRGELGTPWFPGSARKLLWTFLAGAFGGPTFRFRRNQSSSRYASAGRFRQGRQTQDCIFQSQSGNALRNARDNPVAGSDFCGQVQEIRFCYPRLERAAHSLFTPKIVYPRASTQQPRTRRSRKAMSSLLFAACCRGVGGSSVGNCATSYWRRHDRRARIARKIDARAQQS